MSLSGSDVSALLIGVLPFVALIAVVIILAVVIRKRNQKIASRRHRRHGYQGYVSYNPTADRRYLNTPGYAKPDESKKDGEGGPSPGP